MCLYGEASLLLLALLPLYSSELANRQLLSRFRRKVQNLSNYAVAKSWYYLCSPTTVRNSVRNQLKHSSWKPILAQALNLSNDLAAIIEYDEAGAERAGKNRPEA